MTEKLNKGFNIKKQTIDERIEYETQIPQGCYVVPLKMLSSTERIVPLRTDEMEAYLRHIPLERAKGVFPFKNAKIQGHTSGPHGLHVPQTFIQKNKILSLLEGLDNLYTEFEFQSLAQRTAHYVFGRDESGREVVGVYFPPLIEIINSKDIALLFDGNHRMAISSAGAPFETLLIKGSVVAPPYSGMPWHRNFVDGKPPVNKRYVEFNPELFKDFGYVGIDG